MNEIDYLVDSVVTHACKILLNTDGFHPSDSTAISRIIRKIKTKARERFMNDGFLSLDILYGFIDEALLEEGMSEVHISKSPYDIYQGWETF